MKTVKMSFDSIKDSDGWMVLCYELKFEQFKQEHSNLSEDELSDKFYKEVVTEHFEYGEFGSFEIVIDENFNIVGGKIY